MEYDPQAVWDKTSSLGPKRDASSWDARWPATNAFFVRDDLVGSLFSDPFTAENHYEPPRYYLTLAKPGYRRSASFAR